MQPSAAVIDSRTLRSTPESGARAGYDGAKRKKGSKLHLAVDTLGHFLALYVTPANADDRAEVGRMAKAIQAATDQSVEIAFVDQGYTGERPAQAASEHGIELQVVKLSEAKRGFVLLPLGPPATDPGTPKTVAAGDLPRGHATRRMDRDSGSWLD